MHICTSPFLQILILQNESCVGVHVCFFLFFSNEMFSIERQAEALEQTNELTGHSPERNLSQTDAIQVTPNRYSNYSNVVGEGSNSVARG